MPFRRFFEKSAKPQPPRDDTAVDTDSADDDVAVSGDEQEPEAEDATTAPEDAPEIDWRNRARVILPTGASTGSKRPEALYGDPDADAPTHFSRAAGCRVWDVYGNPYIDCAMALGSVSLGYVEPSISRAVMEAIARGHVSSLQDPLEVDVAERLSTVIPCAEMVQFLKTGAEAVSAAVRIARAYTARDTVIGCGYFGWHDWSSNAPGVPAGTRGAFISIPFDDIAALDAAVTDAGTDLAAIVLEPVIERLPSPEWIARARAACDKAGAALIFDEVKTGFRLRTAGYQEYGGVAPDLAAFGKAMSNGHPLAAVVGKRELMEAARTSWISSTMGGESASLAAASAVLDWHEKADICESLWSIGHDLKAAVTAAIDASGVPGIAVDGLDPMWFLRFDEPARETRFLELAARHGVLFKRGPYNFAAMAHDDEVIRAVEAAASAALADLSDEEEIS